MKKLIILALSAFTLTACQKEKTTEERWQEYRQKSGDTTEYFNIEDEASLEILRQMMDEWEQEDERNPKPSHDSEGSFLLNFKNTLAMSVFELIFIYFCLHSHDCLHCHFSFRAPFYLYFRCCYFHYFRWNYCRLYYYFP